ncbi:hypothetical protein HMPREF0578_1404 [Mobiluncus mulieris 28-1]|nr:hypothetical protein HMPREF0578_1404 [Mobiluncus mulieris 28-1]
MGGAAVTSRPPPECREATHESKTETPDTWRSELNQAN